MFSEHYQYSDNVHTCSTLLIEVSLFHAPNTRILSLSLSPSSFIPSLESLQIYYGEASTIGISIPAEDPARRYLTTLLVARVCRSCSPYYTENAFRPATAAFSVCRPDLRPREYLMMIYRSTKTLSLPRISSGCYVNHYDQNGYALSIRAARTYGAEDRR